jgi:hypothetical protein
LATTHARRCSGAQAQVCNSSSTWVDVGAPCANCQDGLCLWEGCSEMRRMECGGYGCACVNNECGGAFCESGDGCSNARRTACAELGCGCVDGGCSGGFCVDTGCTARMTNNCSAFGCGCALMRCVGGACQ